MTVTLAHLSDLHIGQDRGDGGDRSVRRARRVIDHLNGMPGDVDAVLVTGDLADHGTPDEYRVVAELLGSLRFPVLICPGNHDERAAYRATLLGAQPATDPVNRVHHLPGLTVAMCDSSIPGRADGYLDDDTLAWLDKVVTDTGEPVAVCFHHPPVRLHIPFVDGIRQTGAERLAELVGRHDNIAAVFCGHSHAGATTTFAGRPLVVAPGVVSTVLPPFETTAEHGLDYDLPPSIAFHMIDGGLVTHFRSL